MKWNEVILFILLITMPRNVLMRRCSRYPSNTLTPKSPVDENFVIAITGNAQTYILGQSYNVSLHAYNGHRFVSAKLVLENENGEKSFGDDLGHLMVVDPVETRYSQQCVNMIESTNSNPKTKLEAIWVAPSEPGNGCVLIRATVLQHRDVWFMDDGGLTKRVCEEVVDDVESQLKDMEETPCCTCDEARYEIIFEGLWSRNLHPKDFPSSGWITRFSDIVGAAHTSDYRFWDKGVLAIPEMQEFAEHGSSQGLERQFNQYFREGKIRTVIKARGPAFPYINTPSVASVRVDPLHHQVSIASKITPSPDWIVGVPGLELCLSNCTWLEEKVINLYPWDIGTDAGPAYASPDQPQFPADVIRRMSSDYPPDPRSPFFDETHAPMKPLATLTIRRQRLYERKCNDEESNNPDTIPRECFTHPWSAWSECSAECGVGRQYRTRVYKQPDVAEIYNCNVMVKKRQDRECRGGNCSGVSQQLNGPEEEEEIFEPAMPIRVVKSKAECRLSKWSSWSQCNITCGLGMMERTRKYINPYNQRECQETYYVKLREFKTCQGKHCLNGIAHIPRNNEDYNEDNYNFRLPPKPDEPFNNSPEYSAKQYDNPNADGPSDNNLNGQNLEEGVELESQQDDNFPTEDLKQESSYENDLPNRYSKKSLYGSTPEILRNIKPAYRKSDAIINRQIQTNHNTAKEIAFRKPPEYCYQPLNIIHGCFEPRVVGNYWFYNFCTDECMLFATDICDNNSNKFASLEECLENCAMPVRSLGKFLRQKQREGCEGTRPIERNFKKRRAYYD